MLSDEIKVNTHSQLASVSASEEVDCLSTDLICLSHLRWDFVYQRPQHLLSRFAKNRRVFYIEEPIFENALEPMMDLSAREDGLTIVVPRLPSGLTTSEAVNLQRQLIDELIVAQDIADFTLWYYTPMALEFSRHLKASRIIFDVMDELSAFKNAPQQMLDLESELIRRADHLFTGGESLYQAKKNRHPSVHAFASSIDHAHFKSARNKIPEPLDQKMIPHPRVGFYGVVDERFDLELLDQAAQLRPDWHFVIIGPVLKIDEELLPQGPNIHYLGMKKYEQLPSYLAHWDLTMLPFALNDSTKYISPTKTPEYLAAGKPVVSTGIRDVIKPFGEEGLVRIIETADEFCLEGTDAMAERAQDPLWLARVDRFLASTSWDRTWQAMADLERKIDCYSLASVGDLPTSSLH